MPCCEVPTVRGAERSKHRCFPKNDRSHASPRDPEVAKDPDLALALDDEREERRDNAEDRDRDGDSVQGVRNGERPVEDDRDQLAQLRRRLHDDARRRGGADDA